MATATTAAGALIDLFLADPTLSALVPTGAWLGEVPEEMTPLPFVVVTDDGQRPKWLSMAVAFVRSKVRIQAYAAASQAVDAENPAEAVGKAIRNALNEQDPTTYTATKIRVLWALEEEYGLKLSPKRSPADERVYVADSLYNVGFERST